MTAQNQPKKGAVTFGKTITTNNGIKGPDGYIRCASNEYEESLQQSDPNRMTTSQFENWIAPQIAKIKADRLANRSTATIIRIPVVVHVIHNGDAIGSGENIRDEQVLSQITVLNQDYRRMVNTPGFNNNPVGADVEIEFCMAQIDPLGNPTNGIDRVNMGFVQYTDRGMVEQVLKPATIWDSTKYLNMWTIRIGGGDQQWNGVLGYAQFPSGSNLPGLNPNGGAANTDGLVMRYNAFGSRAIYPQASLMAGYDKGRTTTHEIGHWLGLRHIWGDGNIGPNQTTPDCTVDDFCADTPNAGYPNYVCNPNDTCPDPGVDMIENYMDYTPDACMNIFTQDQKTRMIAVMNNATRRSSMLNSTVCNTPSYGLEGSLDIVSISPGCSTQLKLTNYGTTTLTTATITYKVDNGAAQTYNWSGSLASNTSATFTIDQLSGVAVGTHSFQATLVNVNGATDENALNNSKTKSFVAAGNFTTTKVNLALQLDLYGSETTWTLKNSSGTVVQSGGPYADAPGTTLPAVTNSSFDVVNGQCYTFTINDLYQDGICCQNNVNGNYSLKTLEGTTIVTRPGDFGASESISFSIGTLGTDEFTNLSSLSLYPNPAKNILNIHVGNRADLPESYTIINSLGQTIKHSVVNSENDLSINTSNLSNGIYFIKIDKEGRTKTLRFIKN